MKKLLTFSVLALLVGVLGFTSCKKDDKGGGLPAPTGLNETNVTDISATLNWTAVQGAAGYEVIFDGVAKPVTTNVLLAVPNLTASTEYTWSVAAVDAAGGKSTSAPRTFTTATAIAPPSNLAVTASSITATGATFTWTASTDATVTGYEIRFNGGTEIVVPNGAVTYTATTLSGATNYTWDVRAVAPTGKSAYVAGPAFTTSIANPDGLTVENVNTNGAALRWNNPAGGAYNVELELNGAISSYINPALVVPGGIKFSGSVTPQGETYGLNLGLCLLPGNDYTWRIRFTIGDETTDWTDGDPFSTLEAFTISEGDYGGQALAFLATADSGQNVYVDWSGTITRGENLDFQTTGDGKLWQYTATNMFNEGYSATFFYIEEISALFVDIANPVATNVTETIETSSGSQSYTGDVMLDAIFTAENGDAGPYSLAASLKNDFTEVKAEWNYEYNAFVLPYDATTWFNSDPDLFWAFFFDNGYRLSSDVYFSPAIFPGGLPSRATNNAQMTRGNVKTMPQVLRSNNAYVKIPAKYIPYKHFATIKK